MNYVHSLVQFETSIGKWLMNQDIPFVKDKFTASTPKQSGIYLMMDGYNQIIYVGKAKILPKRFSAYLEGHSHRPDMEDLIRDMRTIFVFTDEDAKELEYQLYIKYYLPFYNKTTSELSRYLIIENHEYPSFFERPVYRKQILLDKPLYFFGPILNVKDANKMIVELSETFKLPQCSLDKFKASKRAGIPCEFFTIGSCLGYCKYDVNKELYLDKIKNINYLIKGKKHNLNKEDINLLDVSKKYINIKSRIDSLKINDSHEIIYLYRTEVGVSIAVAEINLGILSDIRTLMLSPINYPANDFMQFNNDLKKLSDQDIWQSFIINYYQITRQKQYLSTKVIHNPKKIYIINSKLDTSIDIDCEDLQIQLSNIFGYKIKVINNLKINNFVDLTELNARLSLEQRISLLKG